MANPYDEIFVVPLVDGRLQYFAIDAEFQLWSCWAESSGWTALTPFQMPPSGGVLKITGGPLSNGTQLWVTDVDRTVWTCWKTGDSNAGWNEWQAF